MSDDWAKRLADKIKQSGPAASSEERNAALLKAAESARKQAAELLFAIFTERIAAINRHLDPNANKGGLFGFLRKSSKPLLNFNIARETTFRFQYREGFGDRLEINYDCGTLPVVRIDVAVAELIDGEYLPILRETGAIAGAQIWFEKRSESKHPELQGRLLLILSGAAIDDGLPPAEAVGWVFEESGESFTARAAERLLEELIGAA